MQQLVPTTRTPLRLRIFTPLAIALPAPNAGDIRDIATSQDVSFVDGG